MGYELHITRRKQWFDDGDDIGKEEFIAYVRSDAEFTYPGECGDDFADWRSPSSAYTSWLQWFDGRILTKNPEAEFVDKMVAIAECLKATVQGDDGEVYRSSAETVKPEPPQQIHSGVRRKPGSWLWRLLLVGIIALLTCLWLYYR
jgi:hypothetical protein